VESARRLADKPYRVLAADAADVEQLRARLAGCEQPDVLIHCLSGSQGRDAGAYRVVYYETLRHLIDFLAPKFTVFTSSTSVYPQNDASEVDESFPVGSTPTGDVLVSAEQTALDAGGAAVRLGGIYGPGRARFIASARANEPLPFGSPDAFINLIHRDDAARAVLAVLASPPPGYHTYNLADGQPAPKAEVMAWLAARLGLPSPTFSPEAPSARTAARGGPVPDRLIVADALRAATGWQPRYTDYRQGYDHILGDGK